MTFRAGTVWAAEDVVQTAYERAIRYRRTFNKDDFGKWFNTVLNNALRDYQAEERGYTPIDLENDEAATLDCPHFPEHIMREIHELIETKSLDQIEVLNLFFKQGYSPVDIASITEHSYAKSRQIVQRFRNELKELYSDT